MKGFLLKKLRVLIILGIFIINTTPTSVCGLENKTNFDYNGSVEVSSSYDKYYDGIYHDAGEKYNDLVPTTYQVESVEDLDSDSDKKSSAIGEKYDPRELGLTTSIKNQGVNEVCWAFAGMAVLESYLKLKGYGTYDLSEEHLRWWATYNDEGYGWNRNADDGGPTQIAPGYFVSGEGPKLESELPYSTYSSKPSNLKDYKTVVNVTDIMYLNNNITDIKKAIIENGAVESCYYDNRTYLNGNAYYYDGDPQTNVNHAIAIVGWDDNYSKDNFNKDAKPQADGAWLIKNSWGVNKYDKGYMWISYEDKVLLNGKNGNLNYSIKKANMDVSSDVKKYEYDKYGALSSCSFTTDNNRIDTLYFANVFDFEEDYRTIKSVMFMNEYVGDKYSIFYADVVDGVPTNDESKMQLLKQGTVEFSGYMTVDVGDVIVKKGKGAIVIKINDSKNEKGASIGCEGRVTYLNNNKVAYESQANSGESFVMTSNEIKDMNGEEMKSMPTYSPKNFSIKAICDKTLQEKTFDKLVTFEDFELYIETIPENNSENYENSIRFLLKEYDNIKEEEKNKISQGTLYYIEKVKNEQSKPIDSDIDNTDKPASNTPDEEQNEVPGEKDNQSSDTSDSLNIYLIVITLIVSISYIGYYKSTRDNDII